jgi:predicted RNA-binding protein associated with RNAse of E/G family
MTKWGDRPHWQFEGIHLGSDEHGEWLGFPQGTHNHRPGYEFHSEVDAVTLVPTGSWYAATFHAPGIWCDLYIDITTPGEWDGDVLRAVDLDLDVIRMSPEPTVSRRSAPQNLSAGLGEVFVDDEDEFAEHQLAFGYPADVIEAAQTSCDQVLAAVRAGLPPYDGTHRRWLEELSRLIAS